MTTKNILTLVVAMTIVVKLSLQVRLNIFVDAESVA